MKRITHEEIKDLSFGSMVRVIWHNSKSHEQNAEYYGVVFGNKIGYEDGKIDEVNTIAECMFNNWCMVYLM